MKTFKILLGMFCYGLCSTVFAGPIILAADEWYPFNGDPESDKPGYMVEIAKEVFRKHGHSMEYQLMPWSRSIAMARTGDIDCIIGAAREEVPDFVFPDEPYGLDVYKFFVHKDNPWRYTGPDALPLVSVGIIEEYAYGETMDEYIAQHLNNPERIQKFFGDGALDRIIEMINIGRLDTVSEESSVMSAKLKELGLDEVIIPVGEMSPEEPDDLNIACSPVKETSLKYTQWLSEGLREMRADGRLQKILDKYGLKDWINRENSKTMGTLDQ